VQSYLVQFMREITCPACHGTRLNPQARAVRLAGQALENLVSLSVAAAIGLYAAARTEHARTCYCRAAVAGNHGAPAMHA
jgi:excinuclease ABC subunit A